MEEEGETKSSGKNGVASVRKQRESVTGGENVRLEIASSSALRDGMKDLRVEEKAEDMMTSKDARGGGDGGGKDSGWPESEIFI